MAKGQKNRYKIECILNIYHFENRLKYKKVATADKTLLCLTVDKILRYQNIFFVIPYLKQTFSHSGKFPQIPKFAN